MNEESRKNNYGRRKLQAASSRWESPYGAPSLRSWLLSDYGSVSNKVFYKYFLNTSFGKVCYENALIFFNTLREEYLSFATKTRRFYLLRAAIGPNDYYFQFLLPLEIPKSKRFVRRVVAFGDESNNEYRRPTLLAKLNR